MTQATDMPRAGCGLRLSFPTARAERLIEGLQAIAELLRDLQGAPTADLNRK
jgi:hypothetical protein